MDNQSESNNINNEWLKILLDTYNITEPILKSLYIYYLSDDNIYKILPILTANSKISIRVLDWFVTNYAKKNNIIYQVKNNNTYIHFNVFLQYKSQLKGYRKKLFDPFCRKKRIIFYYNEKQGIVTTIGQLNFFRWAVKYDILNYVMDNLESICLDMNKSTKIYLKNLKNNDSQENINNFTNENSESSDETILLSKSLNSKINNIYSKKYYYNNILLNKKRQELSENKNKTINKINLEITLNFD